MFLDQQMIFSDAQALAASGASTNSIDLAPANAATAAATGTRGARLGSPPDEGFVVLVFTAQSGTTPTVQVDIQGSPGTIASNGATPDFTSYTASAGWPASGVAANPIVAGRSRTISLNANMLNKPFVIPIQPNSPLFAALSAAGATSGPVRHFRLYYTLGGTTPTCTVTAAFVLDIESLPNATLLDG